MGLLDDLNPAQREAVTHYEGPLLILAGPGSGKTRVITRRVAWLLEQGVKPYRILAITFTNKAAGEMRQRVEALVPGSRVFVSTFHSLGARLLRQYAERLNLDRNFTIYDQADRNRLVKTALEAAGIDNVRFPPDRVQGAISKAKNQLVTPDRYAAGADDFFTQVVARVYPIYEKKLRDANAFDFDDLLYWPALALKNDAELRAELDARFQFVLIDEYQDTNQAQYAVARGLSIDQPNLCVVGDPDQCLPPDTLIQTPGGRVPIADLREGDPVIAASGWGAAGPFPIEKVMVNPYQGRLVKIRLRGGQTISATPNHMCFAKLRADPSLHYVYLMWKRGIGFRLGTTRGVRASKDGEIVSGIQVRTNQEVADAVWIVRSCATSAEARYYEHFYSVRFGIPTMVFFVRGRRMDITQQWIDQLYRDIDTQAAAARLMAELCLDHRYPHHRPGAVTRLGVARSHVHFTMFGDNRPHVVRPWHEHRIQLVTSDPGMRQRAQEHFRVRDGVRGTWRIETSRKHYDDGLELAQRIGLLSPDMNVVPRARLTAGKPFHLMPASHIHPGMLVPVLERNHIREGVVEAVEWEEYEGPVYDLSVPDARNYVAEGIVVHNSIYGWRGANIKNILNFERDFAGARVISLDRNYRSTDTILKAVEHLINRDREKKRRLVPDFQGQAEKVRVLTYETSYDEADNLAARMKAAVESGQRRYRDFAVFMRINALSRTLEQSFIKLGVPYQIVRGLAFFDRKENRDILAYLRLLVNPRDDLSFLRAVNEPARGIGKVSLEHLASYAGPRELSLLEAARAVGQVAAIKGKAAAGLRGFVQLMGELRQFLEAAPDEVIRQVLDRSGYRRMLAESDDAEDEDRLANIEELVTAARQFALENSEATIADFLENITLASDVDAWDEQQDCVSVMTLHAAKGLEFPVVYMIAVEQGLLPHERSLARDEDVEEERRLAFVGMTRAKQELHLCHARTRDFRGTVMYTVPSMFLDVLRELPEDVIEFVDLSAAAAGSRRAMDAWRGGGPAAAPAWHDAGVAPAPADTRASAQADFAEGMHVQHETYGRGRITSVSGFGALRKVKVRFTTAGERTFLANKAKLTVVRSRG